MVTRPQVSVGWLQTELLEGEGYCRSLPYAPPDFLSRLVALANLIRLSLRKAAHVTLGGAAM
jgi:hypothetical protein